VSSLGSVEPRFDRQAMRHATAHAHDPHGAATGMRSNILNCRDELVGSIDRLV
jgi:hypothetical protein